jgi:hypothetical protein
MEVKVESDRTAVLQNHHEESNLKEKETSDVILLLDEERFRAAIVSLILSRETETAVDLLSKRFKVRRPTLEIGHTKGKKIALAVFSVSANSIAFADQEYFFNPFVVLHEMYHCIRSRSGRHRGTEKNADKFALDYIESYRKIEISSSFDLSSIPASVD